MLHSSVLNGHRRLSCHFPPNDVAWLLFPCCLHRVRDMHDLGMTRAHTGGCSDHTALPLSVGDMSVQGFGHLWGSPEQMARGDRGTTALRLKHCSSFIAFKLSWVSCKFVYLLNLGAIWREWNVTRRSIKTSLACRLDRLATRVSSLSSGGHGRVVTRPAHRFCCRLLRTWPGAELKGDSVFSPLKWSSAACCGRAVWRLNDTVFTRLLKQCLLKKCEVLFLSIAVP